MGKIEKRAGTLEEFRRDKIEKTIRMAGATEPIARETAQAVEARFTERLQGQQAVPTNEIRTSVLEELRRRDTTVAQAYEEHKKHQH